MVKYERDMNNGVTDPLLVKTNEDHYVIKVAENENGPRVLVNEFVCYKLARLLAIPIPDAALINIDSDVISKFPRLQEMNAQPGLHFGSRFVPKSQTTIEIPLLKLMKNQDDIPSIILFDQIIYNDDRVMNKGNLLIDLKEKKLLAIDHSHVFKLGALWNVVQLKKIHEEPLCLVKDFHGHNYKRLLKFVNGRNPFNKILQKCANLSQEDIDWCFEDLPAEWLLSSDEKSELKRFICYRIENISKLLGLLKQECHDWKGGEEFEFEKDFLLSM
jgi:hypothetical protein